MRLYNGISIAVFAGGMAVVMAMVSGCDYRDEKVSSELAEIQVTRPVGYAEVNDKIFKKHCVECHTSRGPVLTDYASTKNGGEEIRRSVLVEKRMPRSAPLSRELRGLLRAWLDQGMPELPGEEPASKNPEPELAVVKWADVSNQVLKRRCTQCHYPDNDQGRSSLSDAQSVRDNIDLVLSQALQGQMPPEGQEPLTKQQKLILSRWVIDGMQD